MKAVDTSWLFAFLSSTDEFHTQARRQAAEPDTILVNSIVLVETLDLVRGRSDRATSLHALKTVASLQNVRLTNSPTAANMARLMERHGGISWHDAAAICTALDEGAGLRTFDQAQARAFKAML
ncbi:MAG: PIN domain-containing protein [bacterium]